MHNLEILDITTDQLKHQNKVAIVLTGNDNYVTFIKLFNKEVDTDSDLLPDSIKTVLKNTIVLGYKPMFSQNVNENNIPYVISVEIEYK